MSDALSTAKQFYGAMAEGNVPGALGLLSPDIEWT